MTKPIVVVDSDVILIAMDTSSDPEVERRRQYIAQHVESLERREVSFVIPTPVVAEISIRVPGDTILREFTSHLLGSARVEVLDIDAALIAADIARFTLAEMGDGDTRGAVKYDALIFAIAHRINARFLLTGNVRDYRNCVRSVPTGVVVVDATAPPAGQQVFFELYALPPETVGEGD